MKKGLIILVAVIILALVVATTCTATVQTGYTGIVTTFGKVEDVTLEAGLHFKSPFQSIIPMDNREQKSTFETQAFSSDIQQVDITGSINYAINKSTAMNLFKEVGTDYFNKLVYPRMLEITKGVFSKYTAENLVANRQKLSESIEAKQVAAQKKLQAEIEQNQMTMETQQQAERKRINAEAEANVAKINADADAYALQVRSEAEAEANKKIAESLTENLIRFNEIKAWDGKLPTYMGGEGGTTMPILNLGGAADTQAAGE